MPADNPWLTIPLADYEGHMALTEVGQAQLLATLFAAELAARSPKSVAVLGCAGGNGFEHAARGVRVVGIDVNADYVAAARARFAGPRHAEITPSPFASLERLSPRLRLVAPERLEELAARHGFRALESRTAAASGGKSFGVQSFARG